MTTLISELEVSHSMIVAGAVLVVVGFIGFAFRQNKNVPDELKVKRK